MATRARKAASRPLSGVSDEMVRKENGDIVEVPGAGSLQDVMHIEEGDGGGQHTSDVGNSSDIVRANGERGVNGGEVDSGGLGVNDVQDQARPDEDHRG